MARTQQHKHRNEDVVESDVYQLKISRKSEYEDNVWDFSEEYPELRKYRVKLAFAKIRFPDGTSVLENENAVYLKLVKDFYLSLLRDPPKSRPKITTICDGIRRGIKSLIVFMKIRNIKKFSDIDEYDMGEFRDWIVAQPNKNGEIITNRTLSTRIAQLSWLEEQSSKLKDGLKVPIFGRSITGGEWAKVMAQKTISRESHTTIEMPDSVAVAYFMAAQKELQSAQLIHDIRENYIVHEKIQRQRPRRCREKFDWTQFGLESGRQLKSLESNLMAAAYIVIAMLTGMRVHEVMYIKHGRENNWKTMEVGANEGVKRVNFVISLTTKLEAVHTEYRWQTVPYTEKALAALELGLSHRHRKCGDYLFPSYKFIGEPTSERTINEILKRFTVRNGVLYKGKTWNVASHQFRKKFARIMIRQGLGLKELQDQFKHYDIEMTRGYGDINLYMELQEEKFCLSEELYNELLKNQEPIIGGAAFEIIKMRAKFIGMTIAQRKEWLMALPKVAVIEQTDDGLCMYRPVKAACNGNKQACRPADCNNSIIPVDGLRRTLLWRRSENARLKQFFLGDPLKMKYIDSRNLEIDALLRKLDEAQVI